LGGCAIDCLGFSTLLSSCIVGVAIVEPEHSSFYALPWTVPFWFVGLSILMLLSWNARRVRTIRINACELLFDLRWLLYRRVKRFARKDVQCARRQQALTLEVVFRAGGQARRPMPLLGVEIVHRGGVLLLPVESNDEARWMIQALNDFLDRTRTTPALSDVSRG
jgi:hypothetical protein